MKNTGLTNQDFEVLVMNELTKYPYDTLFNYIPLSLTEGYDLYNYADSHVAKVDAYEAAFIASATAGGWTASIIDSDVYQFMSFNGSTNIYLMWAYVYKWILEDGSGQATYAGSVFFLSYPIAVTIDDTGVTLGAFIAFIEHEIMMGMQLPSSAQVQLYLYESGFELIFNTINIGDILFYSYNLSLTFTGGIIDLAMLLEGPGWLWDNTIEVTLGSYLTNPYNITLSYNTEMTPHDIVRIISLLTGQYLIANGYDIKFEKLQLLQNSGVLIVDFNIMTRETFRDFKNDEGIKEFDEVEVITLWEDSEPGSEDGKGIKPKVKDLFSDIVNTKSRISFEYNIINYLRWGDRICVVNHPDNDFYFGKTYFILDIDQGRDSVRVEAFKIILDSQSFNAMSAQGGINAI